MKRTISLLLAAALLLSLLCACQPPVTESDPPTGPSAPVPVELSCAQILEGVWGALGAGLENPVIYGVEEPNHPQQLAPYLEGAYGLKEDQWEDAHVARQTGASAAEMAVLRFADEDAAKSGEDSLRNYLHGREGDFTGYAPAQAQLVADAALVREGPYLGLFICENSAEAGRAFSEIVRSGVLPEPLPTSTPEPVKYQPKFGMGDLLHRVLLEAACPDWRAIDKGWKSGKVDWITGEIEDRYGIAPEQYRDCVIGEWGESSFYWDEHTDNPVQHYRYQLAILMADTEEGAAELAQALEGYKARFIERFQEESGGPGSENAPSGEDVSVMEGAAVVWAGHYAALIVSEHTAEAVQMFPHAVNSESTKGYFERYINGSQVVGTPDPDYPGRVLFTPPNEEDMSIYDTSAIRAAWETGDAAGLSEQDREVYDAAKEILGEMIQDGMSDYEKEEAVYRWLVENVGYDWNLQDIMAETARVSYQPYGGLVNRAAVCLGYATSFQLLMDLAGVECITVVGASFNSEGDHAWNMVRLNGDWYCVDATWDANGWEHQGEAYQWRYFNVTSDEMAENHQWDYANTPEADTEGHGLG